MKLNKCPFCGSEVAIWSSNDEYYVECDNEYCGLSYGRSCGYDYEEIGEVWNDVTYGMKGDTEKD